MEDNKYLIAIDFETANSSPLSACQVGILVFLDGELIFEYDSLIKPPREFGEFNYYNTKIHNIQADDVINEEPWNIHFKNFEKYFRNATFIAHNASFDMRVLSHLSNYYNIDMPATSYFCTVELSRKIFPYLPNHKLNTVSNHLDITLNHHDALSDANACALIVFKSVQMIAAENVSDMFEKTNMLPKTLTF